MSVSQIIWINSTIRVDSFGSQTVPSYDFFSKAERVCYIKSDPLCHVFMLSDTHSRESAGIESFDWNISGLICNFCLEIVTFTPWLLVSSSAWLYILHVVPCSSVPCYACVGSLRVPQFPSTCKWCEYTCVRVMSCDRLVSRSKYFPSSPPPWVG